MTDISIIEDEDEKPAAKPRKPAAKKRAKPAKKAKPAEPKRIPAPPGSPLVGLTALDCASGCKATCCAISGVGICAHPAKGGLQANLQNDKSLRLYNQAKQIIAGLKLKIGDT
jgi:hypothetical protein